MSGTLQTLANLGVLTFVVSSMLAMGLSLTVAQIVASLRDAGLVLRVLVANFVIVPAVALLILLVIPLGKPLSIGLLLLATAAGAPFLPKLAQAAKGSAALGVGLMVLLMVTTVAYVPLVLPLLLPGVEVNPLEIARSLVLLMLVPLGIGLLLKARYEELAASLQPAMAQASSISLLAVFVLLLALNFRTVIGTVGSGAIIAALLLIAVSFVAGYMLGGSSSGPVVGLGTAQRNVSAAMVVASSNFTDPDVLVMIIVGALLMLLVLMPLAGELGKRRGAEAGVLHEKDDRVSTDS
ncbi:MAG TPA: bile acid:sodium symporter [Rubrobacter sp.]|nr:bile acid:sodium symporter [Rubrobacter sp.]